jgi:uncharacterized protein (DUF1501 family)
MKSRRDFLKTGLCSVSALAGAGALAKLGEMNALAQTSDYKALVCIFMFGGNDGHNMVVPIQTSLQNYSGYASVRQAIAIPQGQLLPVSNGADVYGLNPAMTGLQGLYNNQKKVAILANVGNLVVPVANKSEMSIKPLPSSLYSHSDQQDQWQSGVPDVTGAFGWGGKLLDQMKNSHNANANVSPSITTTTCGLFCSGPSTAVMTVPPAGPVVLGGAGASPARLQAQQQLLSFDNGLKLVQAANAIVQRGATMASTLQAALANSSISTPFPAGNPLATQLQMVARIIKVRAQLGIGRQIFFCPVGGFDTHTGQIAAQAPLLGMISDAVAAFYTATQEILAENQVTTFTSSEFGRTLSPNANGGTDHAWSSHHFIAGGAVQGGKLYGSYPLLQLNAPNDATGRGVTIPTTSVDQYGATLATWFGLQPGALPQVFPNIGNFGVSPLGFLG